jgi:hypothetical protein
MQNKTSNIQLVGGLEHVSFFHILGIIIPSDFIFFRGVETTNQRQWGFRLGLGVVQAFGPLLGCTSDIRGCLTCIYGMCTCVYVYMILCIIIIVMLYNKIIYNKITYNNII